MDISAIVSSLLPIIQQVIAGATKAGGSGVVGKLREAGAAAGYLNEAGEQFKGNPVIEGLLGMLTKGDGLGDIDLSSLNLDDVLNQVGNIDGLLQGTGVEAGPIKQFILGLVEKIVGAAGTGLFGSGEKVSPEEAAFVSNLKGKLGV